jgi:hypothetical protein
MKDQIVENVIDKYYERSQTGITKYGTTLESNNRDNYLKHLQEELMDATLYIEKFLSLEREITSLVKAHGNDADLGREVRKLIR